MTLEDFKARILASAPEELVAEFLNKAEVNVLPDAAAYLLFKALVQQHFPDSDAIFIVGSGNWGYSLNPEKIWTPFHGQSDVDVAVISQTLFERTWEELRIEHRTKWYAMRQYQRDQLRRNAENIYAGFACPKWIPDRGHPSAYAYRSALNKLSVKDVGYREGVDVLSQHARVG